MEISEMYHTTAQVAETLHLSQYRVAELCRQGKLPGAVRLAVGCWLIPADTVLAYRVTGKRNRKRSADQPTENSAD